MGKLTLVGLGPGDPGLLTVRARDVLLATPELVVSTVEHPTVRWLESLGHEVILLESLPDPECGSTIESLSAAVLKRVRQRETTVLATPGHPLLDNNAIRSIAVEAEIAGIGVTIIAGVSFLEASLEAGSGRLPLSTIQLINPERFPPVQPTVERPRDDLAVDPFLGVYREFDPTRLSFVGPMIHSAQVRQVRQWLTTEYPSDHLVQAISFARKDGDARVVTESLANLEWDPTWSSLCLLLPPIERLADLPTFDTLRYIVARLRAPNGCPWDREQNYSSIKKHLIEETYEAIAALEEHDVPRFAEELGDVLLQVVMYAQFGRETRDFTLEDVLHSVNEKLIRRHPHVFGDVAVSDSAEVLRNWEAIKRTERKGNESIFGGIPESAPALMRADAIQSRASRLGWVETANVTWPIDVGNGTAERGAVDLGTLLFDVVSLARRDKIDPEAALRLATNRFRDAFDQFLASAGTDGILSPGEIFSCPEDASNSEGNLKR